jgi:hypothetical protein
MHLELRTMERVLLSLTGDLGRTLPLYGWNTSYGFGTIIKDHLISDRHDLRHFTHHPQSG